MKRSRICIRCFALILTLVLLVCFSACGTSAGPIKSAGTSSSKSTSTGPVTITYFANNLGTSPIQSYNDNEAYIEAQKETGITVKFQMAAAGSYNDQLSIMIASRQLPDIISYFDYPQGPEQAVKDGIILKLNDLIDKEAPDYKKALQMENGEVLRQVEADDGTIWSFSCLEPEEEGSWNGFSIRKDLLDKLGLSVPETMDEWEAALKGFKSLGVESPLFFNFGNLGTNGAFVSAYGAYTGFYVGKDASGNNTVKFGPMEDGYLKFLTTMNKWWKEGLIDKDAFTRDGKSLDAAMTSGKIGAAANGYGPTLVWNNNGKKNVGQSFELVPVHNPSLVKGQKVEFRQANFYNKGDNTVITATSKNVDAAVKFMNFGYTEKGAKLYNYGVEGSSYTMVNGKPQWTDKVLKDPHGWPWIRQQVKVHLEAYLRDWAAAPLTDYELNCSKVWTTDGTAMVLPPITRTADENVQYGKLMTDINTLVAEKQVKFITGQEPLSNFDAFVKQLQAMKINDVLKIENDAYKRYEQRTTTVK